MDEEIKIISERVDDIPLLLAQMERMGVSDILDSYFPTHGNWGDLSLGMTTSIWLSHILYEGDHRLNHVEQWVSHRIETLNRCIDPPVRSLDFADDRLVLILRHLSDDQQWDDCECALNGNLLRVYQLPDEVVRMDSSTSSGYWRVTEDGLFQFGHSKDHRPDLPQVKVMLSSLDPLGMPLTTEVLSGERADDRLYVPAIRKVQRTFPKRGLLYIGDSKMASLHTRAFIASEEEYYLCPLPKAQLSDEELTAYLQPVWQQRQPLKAIYRTRADGKREKIAEGYQCREEVCAEVDGEEFRWKERRLIVRSLKMAQRAKESLDERLNRTKAQLLSFNERKRGKKRYRSKEELQPKVEKILQESQLQELLEVDYEERSWQRHIKGYKDKPARIEEQAQVRLRVRIKEALYKETIQRLGWRVYATTAKEQKLPLAKAILAYRNEFIIERSIGRLKGKPLSLRPMYLQTEEHIVGLIRLLSIALKVLTLLEFQLRQQLDKQNDVLIGLYAGNPKRATHNPTTEQVLKAFQYITLTIIYQQHQIIYHLTELNQLQTKILELLNFSQTIYTKLAGKEKIEPG